MSQDVNILSPRAEELVEELSRLLNERFHIAVRIRMVAEGLGYRLDQLCKPRNRHFVDLRKMKQLPACKRVERVLIPPPPELVGQKLTSMVSRAKTAKGMTDAADLRRLLPTFPELKSEQGSQLCPRP